jgi:hypothetical protein
MTRPDLEAIREKLIEAVAEAIDKVFDKILTPTELEPAKKVRWGKADPADYGTPTTARLGDPNVYTMQQIFDEAARKRDYRERAARQQATVERQQDEFFERNEGRFDREDD